MRTIAIVNQKGGCGKTTTSINLASTLADLGNKILLVDMDPQSHCAVGLAVPEEQIEQSIYDVLIGMTQNKPVQLKEILWEIRSGLDLAPSNIDLVTFEQQMFGIQGREDCLKNVLKQAEGSYDFVIIDCPPAVGLLTYNALKAATEVIVPVETGYFALHGLSKQLETLSVLCQRCDHQVNVKVLAGMYDLRTKMAREILSDLRSHFADRMFATVINFNTKIKEASSFGQPISEYDAASRGHIDFRRLAEEVVNTQFKQQHSDTVTSLATQLDVISTAADSLLQTVEPAGRTGPAMDIDEKLSHYYGVRQIDDAVIFVSLYPTATSVQIAGDFNDWQPSKTVMEKVGENGIWQTKLNLPAGKYRYRLVIDGQWQQDPHNEYAELNPFGDYNSVVEVI